jgi:hypothetical protein
MTIAGFAPERLAAAQVGIDVLEPTIGDHAIDRHLGRRAMQTFGQRHGQIAGAGRRTAEDDGPDQTVHATDKVEHPACGKTQGTQRHEIARGQKGQRQCHKGRRHRAEKGHEDGLKNGPGHVTVPPHPVRPEFGPHQGKVRPRRVHPVARHGE